LLGQYVWARRDRRRSSPTAALLPADRLQSLKLPENIGPADEISWQTLDVRPSLSSPRLSDADQKLAESVSFRKADDDRTVMRYDINTTPPLGAEDRQHVENSNTN